MASFTLPWLGQLALPRLTLLLNHVVSSEPVAMAKLKPHAGRTVDIYWETSFQPPLPAFLSGRAPQGAKPAPWRFLITPAGLFESVPPSGTSGSGETGAQATDRFATAGNVGGLTITIQLPDPLTMARLALKGERPEVNIEGDAALAEVASWMMKNLRWDVQDDLARWMGTAPAELLRAVGDNVRQALQRWSPPGGPKQPGASHGWHGPHGGHRR